MPTEYYRKQAKALLKAARSGDPASLERLSRHPTNYDPAAPKLHDAQLTIAREQGFASWPRFRTFILQSGLDDQGLAATFIDTALSDLRQAEEILAAHPQIAGAGFYVALVLGDWQRVERAVTETPALATGRSGPQNLEPLLYVCFSRFADGMSSRAGDLAETARILLRHGADPNAAFIPEDLPDNPLSCLYAATGLNNNPALALALLEAGANPNDSESLYHSTEHRDLACMNLLLRHGATPAGTNALKQCWIAKTWRACSSCWQPEQIRTRSTIAAKPRSTGPSGGDEARQPRPLCSTGAQTWMQRARTAERRTPWLFRAARQKSPRS